MWKVSWKKCKCNCNETFKVDLLLFRMTKQKPSHLYRNEYQLIDGEQVFKQK